MNMYKPQINSKTLMLTYDHYRTTMRFLISGNEDYSAQKVFNSRLVSVTGMKDFRPAVVSNAQLIDSSRFPESSILPDNSY
jgi:hypothetical protein